MKSSPHYSPLQIALHWLIAAGIFFNYFVSQGMGRALRQNIAGESITIGIANLHVWLGVTIWLLAVLRLAVRLRQGAPAPQAGVTGKIAKAAHYLLYALILVMPLAGMAAWFGGFKPAGGAHHLMATALYLLALLHALAACYHQFLRRDGTLMRMIRPR